MPITVPGAHAIASGGVNNYVMTAVDANSVQGEANLQFDGSTLTLDGNLTFTGAQTIATSADALTIAPGGELILGSATGIAQMQTNGITFGLASSAPAPDNNAVHIWAGDAGSATADSNSLLVIESNTDAYISFLLPNASDEAGIIVGRLGSTTDGKLIYDHTSGQKHWEFYTEGGIRATLNYNSFAFQQATTISTTAGNLTIGAYTGADVLIGDNETILYVDGGTGTLGWGGAAIAHAGLYLAGTTVPSGQEGSQLRIKGSVTGASGLNMSGIRIDPTFTENGASGVHPLIASLKVDIAPVTSGTHTVTDTASVYVAGPMTATVTGANYALFVDAGTSRFDGPLYAATISASAGTAGTVAYSFTDDPDTGVGMQSAGNLDLIVNGLLQARLSTSDLDMQDNTISNVGASGNDWTATSLDHSRSTGGSAQQIYLRNEESTNGASDAQYVATTGGTSGGDPQLILVVTGGETVTIGLDNTADDNVTISDSAVLGSNDRLRLVTSTGALAIDAALSEDQSFDDYDDPVELERWASIKTLPDAERLERNQRLVDIGVGEWAVQEEGPDHLMIRVQAMNKLMAGGIYQNRERMDAQNEAMDARLKRIEQALGV